MADTNAKTDAITLKHGAVSHLTKVEADRALLFNVAEHEMSLIEGIRRYPKAIAWSVFISTAVIMEGFDGGLLSSFFGFPMFQKKYGTPVGDGTYNVSAVWQSALPQALHAGQFIGLFFTGWATDRFGFRKTTMAASFMIIAVIFMQFFAPNIQVLVAAETLVGLPLGVFLTLATVYAAEVCPIVLRPYLTSYTNICWGFGKLLANGILRGLLPNTTEWAYRIPFAIQWIWPPIIIIGTLFAPESPWWFVRHGRLDDARKSLERLTSNPQPDEIENNLSMMIQTNDAERELVAGTSFVDCFRGTNLRRTEIISVVYCAQPLCGFALVGFSTYFFQRAGVNVSNSFTISTCQNALAIVSGLAAYLLYPHFGRRTLYLWGLGTVFTCMFIIGSVGIPAVTSSTGYATAAMLLLMVVLYSMTIGPICYVLVSEIPSSRLRSKSAALARNAYHLATIASGILGSYQMNTSAWNWGAKSGYFWSGCCALLWVWTYYRLPETKDRTYAELDLLFEARTPARKFNSTEVKAFQV